VPRRFIKYMKKYIFSLAALMFLAVSAPAFAGGNTFACTDGTDGTAICQSTAGTWTNEGDNIQWSIDGGSTWNYFTPSCQILFGNTWGPCTANVGAGTWTIRTRSEQTPGGFDGNDTNAPLTVTGGGGGGGGGLTLQLADLYATDDLELSASTILLQVGGYALAIFGILLVVGIGMALLKKLMRHVFAYFK